MLKDFLCKSFRFHTNHIDIVKKTEDEVPDEVSDGEPKFNLSEPISPQSLFDIRLSNQVYNWMKKYQIIKTNTVGLHGIERYKGK